MKNIKVNDTRNFALIGHARDGKSSLGEAILFACGATETLGSVVEGTSSLNYLPEEKTHESSFTSAVYSFDANGKHFSLVDTPGDSNFQADGQIALGALDGAVLVLSGAGGAKVGTARMWNFAREGGLPTIAFVSGMDRDFADFDAAVESLRTMGANPVPIDLPMGAESELSGVIDLFSMKAVTQSGDGEIPAELVDAAASAREQMTESVAECDDELLEKYLEEGELSDADLSRGLEQATRAGKVLPILCGSALTQAGIHRLVWALGEILPSPADRAPWSATSVADGAEVEVTADPEAGFAAIVFKTIIDRYAGTLSVFRVVAGTIHSDTPILNATRNAKERLGKLHVLTGGEHHEVDEAGPGDLVAVAKLKSVHTGDALCAEKQGVNLRPIPIPQGVISYAIQAKSKGDEDKVYSSLGRLVEEDPTLQLGREASTGEFLLTGRGELHVRMTVEKLNRMFGVDVDLKTPKVPYRETITRRAENVEGKLKKQTGGKGMFGVCFLTVEPMARGEGIEFVDKVKGGAIPRSLIPAVEKGVMEACEAGPLAGCPVVDVRVHCIDGKHHPVDSNEMAFKLAGSFGFKSAIEKGKPTILEPVMDVEVSIPDQYVGDIMGDISGRRGRVQSSEARGTTQIINAQVPMSEMLEYASALTSVTAGQGEFHMEFSHYEEAPAHVREKIIATASATKNKES
jgi:elongation factor G